MGIGFFRWCQGQSAKCSRGLGAPPPALDVAAPRPRQRRHPWRAATASLYAAGDRYSSDGVLVAVAAAGKTLLQRRRSGDFVLAGGAALRCDVRFRLRRGRSR